MYEVDPRHLSSPEFRTANGPSNVVAMKPDIYDNSILAVTSSGVLYRAITDDDWNTWTQVGRIYSPVQPKNELSYWIGEWDAGVKKARIWVKVPSIPVNGEAKIKMYYGNPSATSASNGDATFEIFDDYTDEPNWVDGATTVTAENGLLRFHHGETTPVLPMPYREFPAIDYDVSVEWKAQEHDSYTESHKPNQMVYIISNGEIIGGKDSNRLVQINLYPEKGTNPCCPLPRGVEVYSPREKIYGSPDFYHWYIFKVNIKLSDHYLDYFVYDEDYSLLGTAYNKNFPDATMNSFNRFYFGDGTCGGITDNYVKWIRISKYTSPEPTLTLSAEHPTTKPTPAPPTPPEGKIKAVWLYNPDKYDTSTLITDLTSAGINTIFLSTDVNNIWKYERFVKSAHENGIEVHAMILEDPRCALKENHESSIKAVESVLDYNDKSLAKFDGINIDTEPYAGEKYGLKFDQLWHDYITLLEAIHEKTKGKTVLSADIPRWYDEPKIKDLAPNMDFFVIMAYDSGGAGWNTAQDIVENVVPSEMGAIRGEGAKAVIGIGVHEGFKDKGAVEKCVNELYRYYSGDSAFFGVSIFKYETYSGLASAPQVPVPTGEKKGIPGFEVVFALTGLLAVAYLLRRR